MAGLKEMVKSGQITAKEALEFGPKIPNGITDWKESKTYRWLVRKAKDADSS
jgi:hypothetical protein